jgi:hypothetical protein
MRFEAVFFENEKGIHTCITASCDRDGYDCQSVILPVSE